VGFADEMAKVFKKKKAPVDADEIQPGELQGAGVEIQKGDSRLTKGLRLSNLTPSERAKVQKKRQSP
jgi:hypothetical protein